MGELGRVRGGGRVCACGWWVWRGREARVLQTDASTRDQGKIGGESLSIRMLRSPILHSA